MAIKRSKTMAWPFIRVLASALILTALPGRPGQAPPAWPSAMKFYVAGAEICCFRCSLKVPRDGFISSGTLAPRQGHPLLRQLAGWRIEGK
ncbi:MAG: hypothetical protein PHP07_07295 [Eubacteriales bacterium]|nr:hypothetical protein [Eubacteriales bacterium]MDD3572731.1 hypothetical protein [Eubacteriales bacterium]NLO14151.1 hypothetical protein [Clostridiales bacterium]